MAIGCDHGGFRLKAILMGRLEEAGYTVYDCGASILAVGKFLTAARAFA